MIRCDNFLEKIKLFSYQWSDFFKSSDEDHILTTTYRVCSEDSRALSYRATDKIVKHFHPVVLFTKTNFLCLGMPRLAL